MKRLSLIAFCFAALSACTKDTPSTTSPGSIDSVFNGSYFNIGYNGVGFTAKDVKYGNVHYATVTTATTKVDSVHNVIAINVYSPFGIYGLPVANIYLLGNGNDTGYFSFSTLTSWNKAASEVAQLNPPVAFTDTSGTAHITYNGTDYIEGTFTTTVYTTGESYYATGAFKILR